MSFQKLQKHLSIEDKCISKCHIQHVVSENKMTFRLDLSKIPNEDVWVINVDKCMVLNSPEERCDHAFIRFKNGNDADFYYVELKNNRVRKAYNQIVTTITKHFKSPPKKNNYAFIVSSSVPSGTEAQNLRKEFIKKYGVDLIIKNNFIKHTPQY